MSGLVLGPGDREKYGFYPPGACTPATTQMQKQESGPWLCTLKGTDMFIQQIFNDRMFRACLLLV